MRPRHANAGFQSYDLAFPEPVEEHRACERVARLPFIQPGIDARRRSTAPWEPAAGGYPAYEAIIMVQIQNGDPG